MDDILIQIIHDISCKNKILDVDILKSIIEQLISYYDLNDYVKSIDIVELYLTNGNNITAMQYNPKTRRILIYKNNLYELVNVMYGASIFDKSQAFFFINLYILHVAIHELKHAEQYKKSLEKTSNGSEILDLCFNINSIFSKRYNELISSGSESEDIEHFAKQCELVTKEYYEYAPHERMAEIDSYSYIIKLSSEIRSKMPEVLRYFKSMLASKEMDGYRISKNIYFPPTLTYFIGLGLLNELEKFDFYDSDFITCLEKSKKKYNLDDRIYLGLPIDNNEYDEKMKKLRFISNTYN